jgi:hypothetical protein
MLVDSAAVVANLWEVTDLSIDIFTAMVLRDWLQLPESFCTELLQDSRANYGGDLSTCVANARKQFKLKYINGAAPVCYGVPVLGGSSSSNNNNTTQTPSTPFSTRTPASIPQSATASATTTPASLRSSSKSALSRKTTTATAKATPLRVAQQQQQQQPLAVATPKASLTRTAAAKASVASEQDGSTSTPTIRRTSTRAKPTATTATAQQKPPTRLTRSTSKMR